MHMGSLMDTPKTNDAKIAWPTAGTTQQAHSALAAHCGTHLKTLSLPSNNPGTRSTPINLARGVSPQLAN